MASNSATRIRSLKRDPSSDAVCRRDTKCLEFRGLNTRRVEQPLFVYIIFELIRIASKALVRMGEQMGERDRRSVTSGCLITSVADYIRNLLDSRCQWSGIGFFSGADRFSTLRSLTWKRVCNNSTYSMNVHFFGVACALSANDSPSFAFVSLHALIREFILWDSLLLRFIWKTKRMCVRF